MDWPYNDKDFVQPDLSMLYTTAAPEFGFQVFETSPAVMELFETTERPLVENFEASFVEVRGKWGLWGSWSPCSHPCDDPFARKLRTRLCIDGEFGDKGCPEIDRVS